MNSYELLQQYMAGSLPGAKCLSALRYLAEQSVETTRFREAAKARRAVGFLQRVSQYENGELGSRDLLLNLRDLLLALGRLRVTPALYELAQKGGESFDILCENDLMLSCVLRYPTWLENTGFVADVYSLSSHEDWEADRPSAGDELLRRHTRFSSYKSFEQKMAVHTAMDLPPGDTLLISQPTGGGKSLVTQILSAASGDLTLVIVPTVALALDQMYAASRNLKDSGHLHCYKGGQSEQDRVGIIRALRDQTATLLFSSPEAIFKNSELYGLLEEAAKTGYLKNVVIDEAHVVPDWGVLFRPEFQLLSVILRRWRRDGGSRMRTYLLSATLSNHVIDTLFGLFGEVGCNAQLRCDALRQEPRFLFRATSSQREKVEKVLESVRLLPKPMVVYVLEPREAVALQKVLRQMGYKNIPVFTGDSGDSDRDRVLAGWKEQLYDVVIATSAFGIGVDKPDVRTILHACVPETLSRFYQEVGRGGRDGLPSLSLLMPCISRRSGDSDLSRALNLVNKRVLRPENIVHRWFGLKNSSKTHLSGDSALLDTSATPATMSEEAAEYAGNRNMIWNVNLLLLLHRIGYIELENAYYESADRIYYMAARLRKTDLLGDSEALLQALQGPRQSELELQLAEYHSMRELVQRPKAGCWGNAFHHLFPLAKETCSGCPYHPEGHPTLDSQFRLRAAPSIALDPTPVVGRLARIIGSYDKLVVRRPAGGSHNPSDIQSVADCAGLGGIGTLVLAQNLADVTAFAGMVLTHEEFAFVAIHAPYLLHRGVLCVFGFDPAINYSLMKNLEALESLGYRQLLYCDDEMPSPRTGKPLRDCVDAYHVHLNEL